MDESFEEFDSPEDDILVDEAGDDFAFDNDSLADSQHNYDEFTIEGDEQTFGNAASHDSSGSFNLFNLIIVGVAVIGIVGISYLYLPKILGGGSSQQADPQMQMANTNQQKALAEQAVANTEDTKNFVEGGLLNNPEAILGEVENQAELDAYDNQLFGALDSAETSIGGDEDIAAVLDVMPNRQSPSSPQEAMNNDESMADFSIDTLPQPSDALPSSNLSVSDSSQTETNISVSAPAPRKTQPQIPPSPVGAERMNAPRQQQPTVQSDNSVRNSAQESAKVIQSRDDISAINQRLDNLTQSMNAMLMDMSIKIQSLENDMPDETPAQNENRHQEIQALQSMVSRLEAKITELEAQKTSAASAVQTAKRPVVKMESEPQTPPSSRQMPSQTKAPSVKTVSRASNKAYVPPKPVYELRGASPGQAYIAEKGTQNLRMVRVGDIVKGIGQIQSVAIEQGQWVVRGTDATVTQ